MDEATTADELRIGYYRKLLHIAARDLTALTTFEESSAELSDLAVATLGAALAIARAEEPDADLCRFTIMAMGKTGGHELNYLSDVDVIFVHEACDGADDHAGRDRRGHPARRRGHEAVPRAHRRGHDLGGRRRTCGPRARTARWSGRWPATSPTTSAGPAPGSSRRC